jgi:hypothetical protein
MGADTLLASSRTGVYVKGRLDAEWRLIISHHVWTRHVPIYTNTP